MPHAILICDDDPDIRAAMKRTLRGYLVTETTSPREAIEALKTGTFDAIVSDFSLEAESDGLDLLQHVRVSAPDTLRFLVTGNREMDIAARAINEGSVHRYFAKPWDDEKLRAALEIMLRSRHQRGE
ncbi:MAG: response regulator [Deltaproteobacteria bacterium]|nr:response regulator [Deltaproteobacteria bacterium]